MAKTEWDFFGGMLGKAIKAKKKHKKRMEETKSIGAKKKAKKQVIANNG